MERSRPSASAPDALRGYLGINALIETRAGQFWKCWDIKKATFYEAGSVEDKAGLHGCSVGMLLSWKGPGLIVCD